MGQGQAPSILHLPTGESQNDVLPWVEEWLTLALCDVLGLGRVSVPRELRCEGSRRFLPPLPHRHCSPPPSSSSLRPFIRTHQLYNFSAPCHISPLSSLKIGLEFGHHFALGDLPLHPSSCTVLGVHFQLLQVPGPLDPYPACPLVY